MILNHIIKHKCFIGYIIIIIVYTHISYFILGFVGALVGFWILEFLLKYMVRKLTVRTDIITSTYHANCNIIAQISKIYYPLVQLDLI